MLRAKVLENQRGRARSLVLYHVISLTSLSRVRCFWATGVRTSRAAINLSCENLLSAVSHSVCEYVMTPEKINPLRMAQPMFNRRWLEGCVGQLAGLETYIMQCMHQALAGGFSLAGSPHFRSIFSRF